MTADPRHLLVDDVTKPPVGPAVRCHLADLLNPPMLQLDQSDAELRVTKSEGDLYLCCHCFVSLFQNILS